MIGVVLVVVGFLLGVLPIFFWKNKQEFEDHAPENPFD